PSTFRTYAEPIKYATVPQIFSRPGDGAPRLPPVLVSLLPRAPPPQSLVALIEATSNFSLAAAADWARPAGAFMIPTTIGATRAAIPTTAKATFLTKFSSPATRSVRIAWIRLFRSDPVTPDTHTSGDSTYSLQTLRIP